MVAAPYRLDFAADAGKLRDGSGQGTGFTMVDPPRSGTGFIPGLVRLSTVNGGLLQVTTTKGLNYGSANSGDNVLGVGVDAGDQISVVTGVLRSPPAGSGQFEQAGVWYGIDDDNYVKLTVLSTSGGTVLEMLKEVGGVPSAGVRSATVNVASASVALTLRADPAAQTISGSYQVNGGPVAALSSTSLPGEFFNADAAGINPILGTRVFAGVFTSHRNASGPVTYAFDDFSLTASPPAPAPPPGGINFSRTSFPVTNPTSMAFGPDGRLYVSELTGRIHAFTLGADRKPVADQVIGSIGNRLTLGLAFDPVSTASQPVLWVSHSDPDLSNNAAVNSSTVSRLSGAGFASRTDVITGLPRSKADHSVNAIHFGADGRLYIAMAGNTGAGASNTASSPFGDRPEQPLSAAILVADVAAPAFDGSCATPLGTFAPSMGGPVVCSVVPYATGLRNAYDFVFHSNGSMYAPENGLGVTGSFPPRPTPPCTGTASATPVAQGGQNPGEQPDLLQRVEAGRYYGHPNPYRGECIFKNGSLQGVAPDPAWVPPVYDFGSHRSPDGIVEYRHSAFNGALRGDLLVANYSQGDSISRLRLSADGRSVTSATTLADGFSDPLPLAAGPDGSIYVGEFGGGKVTVLIPA